MVSSDFTQLFLFATLHGATSEMPECIRISKSPASASVFVPLTAVLTCIRHQFGAIKLPKGLFHYVLTLIVSQ